MVPHITDVVRLVATTEYIVDDASRASVRLIGPAFRSAYDPTVHRISARNRSGFDASQSARLAARFGASSVKSLTLKDAERQVQLALALLPGLEELSVTDGLGGSRSPHMYTVPVALSYALRRHARTLQRVTLALPATDMAQPSLYEFLPDAARLRELTLMCDGRVPVRSTWRSTVRYTAPVAELRSATGLERLVMRGWTLWDQEDARGLIAALTCMTGLRSLELERDDDFHDAWPVLATSIATSTALSRLTHLSLLRNDKNPHNHGLLSLSTLVPLAVNSHLASLASLELSVDIPDDAYLPEEEEEYAENDPSERAYEFVRSLLRLPNLRRLRLEMYTPHEKEAVFDAELLGLEHLGRLARLDMRMRSVFSALVDADPRSRGLLANLTNLTQRSRIRVQDDGDDDDSEPDDDEYYSDFLGPEALRSLSELASALASCAPSVTEIDFYRTDLSSVTREELADFGRGLGGRLKKLYLSDTSLPGSAIASCGDAFLGLETLVMQDLGLTSADFASFVDACRASGAAQSLTSLDVSYNDDLSFSDGESLVTLFESCPQLAVLDARGCAMNEADVARFVRSPSLSSAALRRLSVAHNCMPGKAVAQLVRFLLAPSQAPNLRELDVQSPFVDFAALAGAVESFAVRAIVPLTALTIASFDLEASELDAAGAFVDAVLGSPLATTLESLALADRLGDPPCGRHVPPPLARLWSSGIDYAS